MHRSESSWPTKTLHIFEEKKNQILKMKIFVKQSAESPTYLAEKRFLPDTCSIYS